jgi:UDP-N-acetylglucosamine--N-acetylmuramyl-(pentapeptide) pyrophosphoryl-undecaprenol N-acetylglucosamine transferase
VPSPNVTEDHQTKNAIALAENNAALIVGDSEAREKLIPQAINLIKDDIQIGVLTKNIAKMGINNSADIIADEILKLIKK